MPRAARPAAPFRERIHDWLNGAPRRRPAGRRPVRPGLETFERRDLPNDLLSLSPALLSGLPASAAGDVAAVSVAGLDVSEQALPDRGVAEATARSVDEAGDFLAYLASTDTTSVQVDARQTADGQNGPAEARPDDGLQALARSDRLFADLAADDGIDAPGDAAASLSHGTGSPLPSAPGGNLSAAGQAVATAAPTAAAAGAPSSAGAMTATHAADNLPFLAGLARGAAPAASLPPAAVPAATAAAAPSAPATPPPAAPVAPAAAAAPGAHAPDPKLFIPQNLSANPGATVTVPVQMLVTEQNGILVSEVDVAVAYDASKFTVSNPQMGSMLSPSTFDVTFFDTTSYPGEILLSAASSISQQSFANNALGAVFTVDFTVKSGTAAGPSPINLQAQFTDPTGLITQPTDVLDNNLNPLTLTPAPTNASNDAVDGIFTVGSTKPATTTTLSAAPSPSTYGQPVTFTAQVSAASGTPTGTVSFMDGTIKLGSATLNNGTATFTTAKLSAATHNVTAVYGGNTTFAGSTSPAVTETVSQAATTTSGLTATPTASVYGQAVTVSVTVAAVAPGGGTPGGTVTFKDGTNTVGTAHVGSNGVATITTKSLSVGSHSITAVYGGNSNYLGSSAPSSVSQTVSKDGTAVALASSLNPSTAGQSVTFTATVTANVPGSGTPSGTVTFFDGSTKLGTGTLSSGKATFTTTALPAGTDSITAVYAGNTKYNGSTSPALSQVVNA
jgi:hypothetical protein